ncbi:MAG TPA: RNA polymerase sporulation sigma factor SigF [Pseudogracilibacillus sp.]|nr:RNA polymerase sporulation sigma factor SigF [Pseudogracilibacillus sp.]
MANTEVEKKKSEHLSYEEVRKLISESQAGDKKARDYLVERNVRLVWSVVQRFINRGYDPEDLFQIGSIGLIKAIDKFDLTYEVRFSTYAVPMIIGEIQRFIRDDGTIKVSRTLKELGHKVRREKEELTKQFKRSPTVSEVALALEVTAEEVVQAEEAIRNPHSIHETVYENGGEPITLLDQIADENDGGWFDRILLEEAIDRLTERERLIVYLRYFKDQTQTEVAERLSISQVQVSRLEKKILQEMKEQMNR